MFDLILASTSQVLVQFAGQLQLKSGQWPLPLHQLGFSGFRFWCGFWLWFWFWLVLTNLLSHLEVKGELSLALLISGLVFAEPPKSFFLA